MPFTFTVYKRIFHELNMRLPKFKPETILDYGAGLGSGVWAANTIFGDEGSRVIKRFAAVEPNVSMRKLGKFLSTDQFSQAVLWVDSLAMIPAGNRGKFDLILVGYVLQEVPTAVQR